MDALPQAGLSQQPLVRPNTDDFSLFVGDLAPDVTDFILQEHFRHFFSSVRGAKVITDLATGRSKGYGFVRFADESQRDRALTEMQGFAINGRPIRVSIATARRNVGNGAALHPSELDPTNTTLFIGGLSAGVSEDQLRSIFTTYGEIVYTKIPAGKGCGFVQFVERKAAEAAMAALNGQIVGSSAIRISWGRSTSRAAATAMRDSNAAANMSAAMAAAAAYGAAFPGAAGLGPTSNLGVLPGVASLPATPGFDAFSAAMVSNAPAVGTSAFGNLGGFGGNPAVQMGASSLLLSSAFGTAADNSYSHAGLQTSVFGAVPGGPSVSAPGSLLNPTYDALAPFDMAKLNAALMLRQQPPLIGTNMHGA